MGGSRGKQGKSRQRGQRGLSASPCLVLVVVAALPFSALWVGAGNAGAALLQAECSIDFPEKDQGQLGSGSALLHSGTISGKCTGSGPVLRVILGCPAGQSP